MKVAIVGSGLLGTSLGLALAQSGAEVLLSDRDPQRARLAADLVQGRVGLERADLVVVATPVSAISEVVIEAIQSNLSQTITDLASVKHKPQSEVYAVMGKNASAPYVPGHPMAGRERSGPQAARADLFAGRPWILTPDEQTNPESLDVVSALIATVGGSEYRMSASDHDRTMAAISHLPQLVASVVASLLGQLPSSSLELAGQGIKDLTRIAGSDPGLWSQILSANAEAIAPLWRQLQGEVDRVAELLDQSDEKSIYRIVEKGRDGRSLLPGKHGGLSTNYAVLPIVVDDRPGQLGALFDAAARYGINVEDLAMEHSPGQQTGLVELSVKPEGADGFVDFLASEGWRVHPIRLQGDAVPER